MVQHASFISIVKGSVFSCKWALACVSQAHAANKTKKTREISKAEDLAIKKVHQQRHT